MIPARVALALQADVGGLRSDIIWAKKNCMPESMRDRPTTAHEHIFLLTKSPRYFYDAVAIEEDGDIPAGTRGAKGGMSAGENRRERTTARVRGLHRQAQQTLGLVDGNAAFQRLARKRPSGPCGTGCCRRWQEAHNVSRLSVAWGSF